MKTFIIAEIAQAHDGSLGMLHSYIDAVSQTGVNAIKFQTHIAEAESSLFEPFRVKFSYVDNTRYDYWKRMEFTYEQWIGIKNHCDKAGLEFLSSPFSCAAVDLLEKVGLMRYKIGSGEVSNFLMLQKIAQTGKEILLSTGMSNYAELDSTIDFLKPFGNKLSILQCTTKYPVKAEEIGLNVITEIKKRYGLPVGLSDHSGCIYPSIAAVTLGAEIIEVHTVFDKRQFGPDSSSSLTINELTDLVNGIRYIEKAIESQVNKDNNSEYEPVKQIFGKALAVNQKMAKGSVIQFENLESKKPASKGIPASKYKEVIGRKLKHNLEKWDFLTENDLE